MRQLLTDTEPRLDTGPVADGALRRTRTARKVPADAGVLLAYLALAVVVVSPLWTDVSGGYLVSSVADQTLFEWYLSYAAHAVVSGDNPFHTTALGTPDGINLMANTSVLGLGVPLTPVTLAFGPTAALATGLTAALAGTAAAWYRLLSRRVLPSFACSRRSTVGPRGDGPDDRDRLDPGARRTVRIAAAAAAGLIGFSPTLVAHAAGSHLNLSTQFVLPVIVWWATRLHVRPVRSGVVLGLLVTYQLFVGEEVLLYTAVAIGVWTVAWAARRRRAARAVAPRFLAGLGTTAAVAALCTGPVLWLQFAGPVSYSGMPFMQGVSMRLPALVHYSTESLGGLTPMPTTVAPWPAEENGFLGWPLLVLAVAAAGWLWRLSASAGAVAVTGVLFAYLATGRDVVLSTGGNQVPGPWRWIGRLPLVESAAPARLTMVVTVCVAVVLAMAACRLVALPGTRRPLTGLLLTATVAVLLPLTPTPLTAATRPPVPAFFTGDHWTRFVRPGHTLVAARRADIGYAEPMRWQMTTGFAFRINGGYFIRPGADGRHAAFTPPLRPVEVILARVLETRQPQAVDAADRRAALADLRTWRADAVVLEAADPAADAVRTTMSRLFSVDGHRVAGMWVWDVRGLA